MIISSPMHLTMKIQLKQFFLLNLFYLFTTQREFEIDPRFEHIEFKLNLIQQNAKFFIDILHNQKSDTLEWIIIILITFECVLSLMDMSGIGPSILQHGGALDMVKVLPVSPPPS